MTPSRVVIVGASLAGLSTAIALRQEGFAGELVLVGEEDHPPYDRPPLSKELLAGERDSGDVALRQPVELRAEWMLGSAAAGLDLNSRAVQLANGRVVPFDGLVIATGSRPRRLPGLVPDRERVFELRTLDDALALRAAAAFAEHALVVGTGFIGVEVAATLRGLGVAVTMCALDPPLSAAGPLASDVCTQKLAAAGIDVHIGVTVRELSSDARATTVVLDDGRRFEAQIVVSAVGVVPATGWLEHSGVPIADGVVCDTSGGVQDVDGVVAAGDVACWPSTVFGGAPLRIEHWTNAREQGSAAARRLMHGPGVPAPVTVPSFWSNHLGARLQSVGLPHRADRFEVIDGTVESHRFGAQAYRDDKLVGAVAYDSPRTLIEPRGELLRQAEAAATPR